MTAQWILLAIPFLVFIHKKELIDQYDPIDFSVEILGAALAIITYYKTRKKNDVDNALLTKGGIDLNNLNMQTSGQATEIQMPSNPAMLNQPIKMLVPKFFISAQSISAYFWD